MPLYEYQCQKCNHRFEKIQKFSDPIEDTCPSCGGPVQKLMSSPAIQFKGTGWYITDYAKKDQVTATKAGEASGNGSSETKADTTAPKTDSAPSSASSSSTTTTASASKD